MEGFGWNAGNHWGCNEGRSGTAGGLCGVDRSSISSIQGGLVGTTRLWDNRKGGGGGEGEGAVCWNLEILLFFSGGRQISTRYCLVDCDALADSSKGEGV